MEEQKIARGAHGGERSNVKKEGKKAKKQVAGVISTEEAKELILKGTSEKEFMEWIMHYARIKGWLVYHTHDSRRSNPGFPDLVLVRDKYIIFFECKRIGKFPTRAQRLWLDKLSGSRVLHSALVTPRDYDIIEDMLR